MFHSEGQEIQSLWLSSLGKIIRSHYLCVQNGDTKFARVACVCKRFKRHGTAFIVFQRSSGGVRLSCLCFVTVIKNVIQHVYV